MDWDKLWLEADRRAARAQFWRWASVYVSGVIVIGLASLGWWI